ncbi:RNA polymerase sigma factor SigJ [Actinomadura vinacea]|uniref:RNA polymerase sigma factor SigJ n=1 Tax=Actinomadura vinacea TaxID=115336 RepID=A0ABN3JR92_9ACTN
MDDKDFLADRFEGHRSHLRAVAYRMLGSLSEAEDAVQEAWLRLSRADADGIENLGGWLTTVVGRVCLDMLRSRTARRETPLESHLPDPVVSREDGADPEEAVLIADSVGLALLVVLESLSPAERVAFVLHDMFGVPFDQIAPLVGRSADTTKKLASRARRRVRGEAPVPDSDPARQREVVEAFLAAAREGDFEGLLAVLDPEVVLRADTGAAAAGGMRVLRGAAVVAGNAVGFQRFATAYATRPVLVNGAAGILNSQDGRPVSVLSFIVVDGRIAEIHVLSDPDRLAGLDLTAFDG